MVLDLRLEVISGGASATDQTIYKAANWNYGDPNGVAYTETPCSYCRLKSECGPSNKINPQTCQYMQDWLEMF